MNPTDGVLTAIKAAHQYETPKRHALTLPQQQAFLNFIKMCIRDRAYTLTERFSLPGTSEEVQLFLRPRRGRDGTLYGLCGFEISQSFFKQNFAQQMCIRDRRKSPSCCCRLSPAIISGTRSAPGCAKMRPT